MKVMTFPTPHLPQTHLLLLLIRTRSLMSMGILVLIQLILLHHTQAAQVSRYRLNPREQGEGEEGQEGQQKVEEGVEEDGGGEVEVAVSLPELVAPGRDAEQQHKENLKD